MYHNSLLLFHFSLIIFSFWIDLNSIAIYCNDNRTRTFLSLSFAEANSRAEQNLQNIVRKLDSCFEEFKLPPFYKVTSFLFESKIK